MRTPTLDSHESAIVDRVLLDQSLLNLNWIQAFVVTSIYIYEWTEPQLADLFDLERHQIQTIKKTALGKLRREMVVAA